MECRDVRPALSDLVDGTFGRDGRTEVEAHLQGCSGCRALLADLRRTREAARALPKVAAPETLWPKIRAAVGAESGQPKRAVDAVAVNTAEKNAEAAPPSSILAFVPRRPRVLAGLAAAAVIVMAVSAGLYLTSRRTPAQTGATPTTASAAAAGQSTSVEAELDLAEQHYQKAIAALEQTAKEGQGTLDPQTAAVLQKNMGLVDQAIRESRSALRAEPTSEAAQSTLFEALQRKVGLLRDTISLINEMRKGDAAGTARVAGTIGKS